MNDISSILAQPKIQAILNHFHEDIEVAVAQIIAIQQIPSPTFAEAERASYIEKQLSEIGLEDIIRDSLSNVYGRLPGKNPDRSPVVISAHLDTVFPAETNLAIRREDPVIYGPGVGDNSTGLAGLLLVSRALIKNQIPLGADVYFVANVGEEGLGDLRGMRAVVERFGDQATYIVVEGGLFGQLIHQAVGVRRYRMDIFAPGGHSWGGFGAASAIHVLGHLITAIDGLEVPTVPRTTYNVGLIEGGVSINTIANAASMWLDLRSEGEEALAKLIGQVEAIVVELNRRHAACGDGVRVEMVQVGNRPAGSIDRSSPIVASAESALRAMGYGEPRYIVSSTDANIPLSLGYQAICVGLTQSANSHRPDEFIDVTHLPNGLGQLLLLILAAAG